MGDLAAPSAAQGAGVSRRIATNTRGMGGTDGGSSLGTVILVLRASLRSARTPVLSSGYPPGWVRIEMVSKVEDLYVQFM